MLQTNVRKDDRMTTPPIQTILGIENKITTGQLLIGAIILVSTATIYMGRVDTNQSDTKTIKTDMASLKVELTAQSAALKVELMQQMTQMQINNDKQFAMTRASIDNIPSMNERVTQLERWRDKTDRVVEETRKEGIETTTNMNNLLRQLGAAQRVPR